MKLKIVMCEGAHDIGFISKILLANGYKEYDKKIKEYPKPLNDYICNNMVREQVGDKKLGFNASYSVPYASYIGKNSLFLFHNMGGDARIQERYTLMDDYTDIMDVIRSGLGSSVNSIEGIDFYLFYDSDNLGIEGRVEDVRNTFAERYGIKSDQINHGKKAEGASFSLGIYIFHNEKDPEKKGTLEDHIISLFEINNKRLVDNAQDYLHENGLDEDRTKEYYVENERYKGRSKFNMNKSIISVAGQLQFSGMSNSVIISKSDYITKADICENIECQKIVNLLES